MSDNLPAFGKPYHCLREHRILLWLSCSFFIFILLGLGLYYHTFSKTASSSGISQQAPLPCLSAACLQAAARLSSASDPFVQPCDYFLTSCRAKGPSVATRGRRGGKEVHHGERSVEERAPGDKRPGRVVDLESETDALLDRLADKQTALLQVLREILESPSRRSSMDSAELKMRIFYHSCMNTSGIEKAGSQPVLKLIQKLGGWAVFGEWNRTNFDVTLSVLMKNYSTFPFFSVYVGKDPKDSASSGYRMYIQIDQPEFQIPVEWDGQEKKSKVNIQTLRQLLSFQLELLALLGVRSNSTNLHTGKFLQLFSELILAASPLPHRLQQQQLYHRMTLRELQAAAPAIDWLGSLRAVFHPLPVNPSEVVLLHNLPYIIHMSRTISKWQRSSELGGSDSLHTFMILSLLHRVIPALNSKFTKIQRNLFVRLGETSEVMPHWKKCVLEAEKGFDTVLIASMKERIGEKQAKELVQDIYSSLKSRLSMLEWRDEDLHSSVLSRVASLTPKLSINTEILSQASLDQQYAKVAVSAEDYFSNYVLLLSLQRKRGNKLLSGTTALDIMSLAPFISSEEINIPLGMFVPPFFHPSYPRAVNYGILGTLIAKEILHLLLPDIQSQSEAPKKVSDCVWAHYLHLTKNLHMSEPSPLTPAQQLEIWVQHTALHTALQAYNRSLTRSPRDTSLSSLSYTHLFLASFAQNKCSSQLLNEHLPFEPFFLVTVICMNSDLCAKPMICTHSAHQGFSQKC
ncbi:hypothetical protein GJAV_G00006590 [Gymnothorax javanicus]|nr:hypothetical protein GJAV_G00006590 [Gymnothorax javanicus]